jgi:hypothetical protein
VRALHGEGDREKRRGGGKDCGRARSAGGCRCGGDCHRGKRCRVDQGPKQGPGTWFGVATGRRRREAIACIACETTPDAAGQAESNRTREKKRTKEKRTQDKSGGAEENHEGEACDP